MFYTTSYAKNSQQPPAALSKWSIQANTLDGPPPGYIESSTQLDVILPGTVNTFSYSFWYRAAKIYPTGSIAEILGSSSVYRTDGFGVRWNDFDDPAGGSPGFVFWIGGNFNLRFAAIPPEFLLGWLHIVYVYDGVNGTVAAYVNGNPKTDTINVKALDTGGAQKFKLHRSTDEAITIQPHGGWFDDVAIYDKALTPADVSALYAGTADPSIVGASNLRLWWRCGDEPGDTDTNPFGLVDASGLANDAVGVFTLPALLDSLQPGMSNISANIGGVAGRYLRTASGAALGLGNAWSIQQYVQPAPTSEDSWSLAVGGDGLNNTIELFTDASNDINLIIRDSGGTIFKQWSITLDPSGSAWLYIALSWDGTNLLSYDQGGVDENTVDWVKVVDNVGVMTDTTTRVTIGSSDALGTGDEYEGKIYGTGMWNIAFAMAEVAGNRAVTALNEEHPDYGSGASANLVHYWDHRVDGNTLADRGINASHALTASTFTPVDTAVPEPFVF